MVTEIHQLMFDPLPWMEFAKCKGVPPEVFFPEKGGSGSIATAQQAKKVCNGDPRREIAPCPVREECLEYALALPRMHGIWGGTAFKERERIRRLRKM